MRIDRPADGASLDTPPALPLQLDAVDRVLARLRQGEAIDARAIEQLALASFEAGIAAAREQADTACDHAGRRSHPEETPLPALTPRRLEVLRLVARGLTNDEIGQILGISRLTVKSHLSALFTSLEVTNRTDAAFAFQRYEARQGTATA